MTHRLSLALFRLTALVNSYTLRLLLFLAALTLSALCAGLVDWLGRPLPPLIIASPTVPAP